MLSEHERYYGLGMDALASVCSRKAKVIIVWAMDALISVCSGNANVMVVWAWMLWSAYALGTPTLFWFGHGCFGQRMRSEHER